MLSSHSQTTQMVNLILATCIAGLAPTLLAHRTHSRIRRSRIPRDQGLSFFGKTPTDFSKVRRRSDPAAKTGGFISCTDFTRVMLSGADSFRVIAGPPCDSVFA